MPKPLRLYSAAEVAAILGNRKPLTVRQLARRHHLGQRVAKAWVFTEADIEAMRKIPLEGGRPSGGRVVRHRWGPDEEGARTCKHCGAVSTWDGEKWTAVPPCQ